ncbi:Cystathionine beta-lyase [Paramagnetospirillum magnetotacticum MS-1]|uniref:Cystathionine beta-lyase n=1 Tax=Paramagnetospirillum magnetotacticum MS-1 TaxID=272627 RepID=A0A0C2V4C1_PARME|nr:cystathionine beta-lyase [Paramagnetospirillum magnetotacticum]KIL99926.1 Cystathionine beta-lyase [Paramagnetospirillum magnetotacticum MS-1]
MKKSTRILHAGRKPEQFHGAVNPPVYHASTILHPSVEAMEKSGRNPFEGVRYGRFGTPTTFALEEAVAELEGGHRTVATSSGLAAITGALLAFLKAGDHLLMVDTAYFPTRKFCDTVLSGLGIEITYYDPLAGAGIKALMRPNTKVVFTESPGSLTFEVQDIPAIAEAAHAAGAIVMMDNTWGVLHFQPFTKGVDVSIQAATKYIVGHADAMLGTITAATPELWLKVKTSLAAFGASPGTEEMYLGLRGLRTLAVRLRQHAETALRLTQWLETRPEVESILYPPLASDPGHALWKRDFTGGCGLFGVILKPASKAAVDAMLDGYSHFKLGFSWGGFESLVIPTSGHSIIRTATSWAPKGPSLRFHAGLEDADDLMEDLERGFGRLACAGS